MLKLIVGVMGTGKTKALIGLVNSAAEKSTGSVVCIERGTKLTYDINHSVRLIDTKEYGISTAGELYGLVCGVYANNYDVTDIFIDSALKICSKNMDDFVVFVDKFAAMLEKHNLSSVVTVSFDIEALPEELKKYL